MSYNTFAKFYDTLTENVEYKKRVDYISSFFKRYADKCDTVLDLACGTGSVSKYLSDLGYNVIGLDLSDEMLTVASSKQIKNAMFIKGDMTNFELPHKVDCCVCSLDSINHLKDIVEVKKVL
ncbi:MAG: class I SAM-dependent DNA methyltransferase [Eubacterium sp.]